MSRRLVEWIYLVKIKPDWSLDHYITRIVPLGNSQEYRIDHDETFKCKDDYYTHSPCSCCISIMASIQNGLKNAFPSWGSQRRSMHLPLCLNVPSYNSACCLRRFFDGLKKAARAWFEEFQKTLQLASFLKSQYDPSIFFRWTFNGITILLLSMDGINHNRVRFRQQPTSAAIPTCLLSH